MVWHSNRRTRTSSDRAHVGRGFQRAVEGRFVDAVQAVVLTALSSRPEVLAACGADLSEHIEACKRALNAGVAEVRIVGGSVPKGLLAAANGARFPGTRVTSEFPASTAGVVQ